MCQVGRQVLEYCTLPLSKKYLFIYLLEKEELKGREGERDFISVSLPKWLLEPGLSKAEARNLELYLGLPCGMPSSAIFPYTLARG